VDKEKEEQFSMTGRLSCIIKAPPVPKLSNSWLSVYIVRAESCQVTIKADQIYPTKYDLPN